MSSQPTHDDTTWARMLLGLAAGAFCGGLLAAIGMGLIPGIISKFGQNGNLETWSDIFGLSLILMAYASVVYAVGLVCLGAPAWALLHWLGWRRNWHAALLGAVLNFGALLVLLLSAGAGRPRAGLEIAQNVAFAAMFAAAGAIVGSVIWWIAYRWDKPLQPLRLDPS